MKQQMEIQQQMINQQMMIMQMVQQQSQQQLLQQQVQPSPTAQTAGEGYFCDSLPSSTRTYQTPNRTPLSKVSSRHIYPYDESATSQQQPRQQQQLPNLSADIKLLSSLLGSEDP